MAAGTVEYSVGDKQRRQKDVPFLSGGEPERGELAAQRDHSACGARPGDLSAGAQPIRARSARRRAH